MPFAVGTHQDDGFHRRPAQTGGLAQDQHRIGPIAAHQPVGDIDRHLGQRRKRDHRLFVFAVAAERGQRRLVHACRPDQAEHDALRGAVIARADAGADFFGDFRQHAANLRLSLPASPRRAGADARPRSPCQQFAEHRRRNVRPQPDLLGQDAVVFGALDQAEKPVSEMRAPRLSATRRATSRSPRRTSTSVTASPSACRAEMACRWAWLLVLATSTRSASCKPRRQLEHRPGDGDVVVVGERAQHLDRRVARPAPDGCESSARALLSISSISRPNHVVEQVDMLVVVAARRRRETAP